jgi:uncharacterized protein YcnI
MTRVWLLLVGFLVVAGVAEAHVTILPRESRAAAVETYSMRVPTEGKVTTVSVELEVPDGVTIVSVEAQTGTRYETKRSGDRITSITWTTDIKPGESRQFAFKATNPKQGSEITWKAHQRYEDGTSADWIGPVGDPRPAPVTKLVSN